ncbi:M60 family metallopeptidase [Bacillus niameyensis]|uniref:M60 family metallopeptidase n=1 Tax=Bacillus niameyensis TaxID=1522308 RepID=UPI000784C8FA|nr:M60 family metallopeptidase [Bacillus niameyensis]
MRKKVSVRRAFTSIFFLSVLLVSLFPGASISQAAESISKTITLAQHGKIEDERDRLKVTFGPSYYLPTGLYVNKGQKITVNLNEHDQVVKPRLVISPPVLNQYREGILDGIELQPGINEITADAGGILYLINQSGKTATPAQAAITGANPLPTFELGKTSITEWQVMLDQYSNAPAFELVSDKVMITSSMNFVDLVSNPEELLKAHDEAVEIEARVSGLSENDPNPLHRTTEFRYHFRQTQESGYWMYAWYNHTAYITDAMQYVLDVNKFINDGWGPWHELGHVHQQSATTPGMFGEVTNNVFSLTVQKHFGQPSRLEADNIYERVFQYLDSPTKDFASLDVWEKLVMLWQLDLAYGENFHPAIYKMVRETPANELPRNDEEKLQRIMYWSSKAAGQNLISFFEKWGLTINEDTRQDINSLGLPELNAPIWWNTDSNNTIKPFDIKASSIFETLVAYQGEIPADVYRTYNLHLNAIKHYEEIGEYAKVVKHTESFQLLLNQQKESDLISEKVHDILHSQARLLIENSIKE